MPTPTVSVIIATYNCSAALRLALGSLLRQTFTDLEVWVVGDACTDDTADAVAELNDGRLHYLARAVNSGSQAQPNNEGFAHAAGDFIAYLNHDDLWFPWHLEGLVRRLEESGAEHVHDYYARAGQAGLVSVVGPPPAGRSFADHFVCPSSWLVRRSLLERVGPWPDPDRLPEACDMAMLRRFQEAGARFACEPRLGMLKFPSRLTRSFADHEAGPQTSWSARLIEDPQRLEHEVLWELARLQAGAVRPTPSVPGAVRHACRAAGAALAQWYGPQRWPVSAYRVWLHQRHRRRSLAGRGLPTAPPRPSEAPVPAAPTLT